MTEFGYALSSEEHSPKELVSLAQRAEETGFTFAMISDHIHPWIDRQGNSSFVWSVMGAIAQATDSIRLGTAVTCPIIRTHPAIIAHAAATMAELMPGRFWLGLGSGENLNEHVTGEYWPPSDIRRAMLSEAVEIIRLLWSGESIDFYGDFYNVVDTRLYTLPTELPPILIAAGGTKSAELAGTIGDGLITTAPDASVIRAFTSAGGKGGPKIGQLKVCVDENEQRARETAWLIWPTAALGGELGQELSLPRHFEQAAANVTVDQVADKILCGADARKHVQALQEFIDAGFDHVYIHNIGPDQETFFNFYKSEVFGDHRQIASLTGAA